MRSLKINNFRGEDSSKDPTQLDVNQAREMINMELRDGYIKSFNGYDALFSIDNAVPMSGSVTYVGYNPIADCIVFCSSEGVLYKIPKFTYKNNNIPAEITGSDLTNAIVGEKASFYMNNIQYFLDGYEIRCWDGLHSISPIVPYIPTTVMGRAPAGDNSSQTAFEERNLISNGFKNSFSSDGVATIYVLNENNLDSTPVTVKVGVTDLVEGTHFIVDRTAGTINFGAEGLTYGVPPSGTDNVIITAYKNKGNQARINECTKSILYGYGNDSRVFLYGNSSHPNTIFWSHVYDATYYPENNYVMVGDNSNAINGIAKQLDSMLIFKETSNNDSTIWIMTQEFDDNGNAIFDVKQGISGIGMDNANSLQTIEDKPIFVSKTGVYRVTGTNVKDERILEHISSSVDKELLGNSTFSFDYDNKYCVVNKYKPNGIEWGDAIFVFDYNHKYIRDNIVCYECYKWDIGKLITSVTVIDNTLYIGATGGMIYVVKKDSNERRYMNTNYSWSTGSYVETNSIVQASYKTKYFDFDSSNYKHIHKIKITPSGEEDLNGFNLSYDVTGSQYVLSQSSLSSGGDPLKQHIVNVNQRDVLKSSLSISSAVNNGDWSLDKRCVGIAEIEIEFSYGREYKGW